MPRAWAIIFWRLTSKQCERLGPREVRSGHVSLNTSGRSPQFGGAARLWRNGLSRAVPKPRRLPSGRWLARVTYHHPVTGRRCEVSKTFATEAEAEVQIALWLKMRTLGKLHTDAELPKRMTETINFALDRYFTTQDFLTKAQTTRTDYLRYAKNLVRPKFGEQLLTEIHSGAIQEWLDDLVKAGRGRSVIQHARSVLSNALAWAVLHKLLPTNPAAGVKLHWSLRSSTSKKGASQARGAENSEVASAAEKIQQHHLDAEEMNVRPFASADIDRLKGAIQSAKYRDFFRLLLGTGLRPSEARALIWEDIDLKKALLKVRRSVDEHGNLGVGKSFSARRTISLPLFVVKLLKDRKPQKPSKGALVFPGRARGSFLTGKTLRTDWHKVLKRGGFWNDDPELRHRIYDLRHTHATRLYELGTDANEISRRLGHSNLHITLQVYVWETAFIEKRSAEKAQEAFG